MHHTIQYTQAVMYQLCP